MLNELYKLFKADIVASTTAKPVQVNLHHDYAIIDPKGETQFIPGKIMYRHHHAYDLKTIAAFADRGFADFDGGAWTPACWYQRDGVTHR